MKTLVVTDSEWTESSTEVGAMPALVMAAPAWMPSGRWKASLNICGRGEFKFNLTDRVLSSVRLLSPNNPLYLCIDVEDQLKVQTQKPNSQDSSPKLWNCFMSRFSCFPCLNHITQSFLLSLSVSKGTKENESFGAQSLKEESNPWRPE